MNNHASVVHITENMTKYFEQIRAVYQGPIAMLYAVEILLSDDKLMEPDFLLELQDQAWGGSKLDSYLEYLSGQVVPKSQPVFRVELDAIRRWKADEFYPAEVFWIGYLGRMTGVSFRNFAGVYDEAISQMERGASSRRMAEGDGIVRKYAAEVIQALALVS